LNNLVQGLEVSVLGILITFFALGVFIIIMIVLQRLFPAGSGESNGIEQDQELEAVAPLEVEVSSEDDAVVAAIAAAISFLRAHNESSLGGSLEEGRSGWWATRRLEARIGKVEKR
jgi:sodium pump decarboxylase gamma subunit